MRCEICNGEFSESVYPLHIERCKPTQPSVDDEPTQPSVEQQIEFPRKKRNR